MPQTPFTPFVRTSQALPAPLQVPLLQPLQWLALGARDICHAPLRSLTQGLALALWGALVLWLGRHEFAWLVGALSGFLVVGPVVAIRWYAISRALQAADALPSRPANYRGLLQLGGLLALSAIGWMVVSAALITLCSPVHVATPQDFLLHVVAAADGTLFYTWLALGSFLAAPIFASTVVSVPLLLDRKVSLRQAVFTSWLVVLRNPIAMAVWAAMLVVLGLLGMASLMLGMVWIIPMVGHASWHAYRDLVDTSNVVPKASMAP